MKRWAVLTALLYGVILLLLTLPLLFLFGFDFDDTKGWYQSLSADEIKQFYLHWGVWLWLGVMVAGQVLLLAIPLNLTPERPVRRRRLWLPIVTGGFFLGNLALAGLFCVLAVIFHDDAGYLFAWPAERSVEIVENVPLLKSAFVSIGLPPSEDLFLTCSVIGIVGLFWAVWAWVFSRYASADEPEALMKRTTRWLLRGSALELLVAVPSHVIVRQRDDCCAPMGTFWGISLGLSVMLLSFGPGVFFLFAERMRRLKPRTVLANEKSRS